MKKKNYALYSWNSYCFNYWWGLYAYNIYSSVTDTLSSVHKPLDRDKSDKRNEKVDIVDQNLFRF